MPRGKGDYCCCSGFLFQRPPLRHRSPRITSSVLLFSLPLGRYRGDTGADCERHQGLLRPAVAPALPTSGGATLERQGRGTRSFRSGASSQSGLRELRLPTHRNRDGLRVDEIDGRKALGAVVQLCLGGQHRQESCDRIRARHRRPSVCLAGLADLGCLPL
jgi:hypothetical protein